MNEENNNIHNFIYTRKISPFFLTSFLNSQNLGTIFILPKISESCRVNRRYTETVIHWVSNVT